MGTKVMVVDDSGLVRLRVRRALADAGFHVTEASDGEDALLLFATARPDILVCDVTMPRMSGIELLEHLQASGLIGRVQVLMLTTEGQPELIQRARGLGAKGWIFKPFKPEQLLLAVQRLAELG